MAQKIAVFDDALSFYRYLPICRRDREWGLYVTGAAHEVMTLQSESQPPSARGPYHLLSKSGADDEFQYVFDDLKFPRPYRYDWEQGRTFVDEFALLYFDGGASWILETEASQSAVTVTPGSVVLLFPDVWHRYRPVLNADDSFSSTLACTFGGEIARRWQQRGLISPRQPVSYVGNNTAVDNSFRRLHNQVQSGGELSLQQSLAGGLHELLGHAVAAAHLSGEPILSSSVIRQAKAILEDLAVPDPSPEKLAQMLHCSYDRFRRSFRIATGMSPYQYSVAARVRRVKELLEETDMPVREIAAVVRFYDQFHLAKLFKRKTGVSPTEWRARARRQRRD